ncbi:MAG TPA: (2Fe-2S)-binding protein [Ramlibacter sp.]|uniref:(2Fe-2S)-binding protein n=1 Tax=Ramlibacter sp. TaxID=1917967 RepID=UPI002D802CAA|nr:(2Fe-2S)-binding protein [Ramlibacter sp.]HET8746605.1 (2Fe-2S)-binding protein [Ramlibacter sp.]
MHTKPGAPRRPLFTTDSLASATVTVQFEGERISVPAGVSIAAALLLKEAQPFRTTPVSQSPRAPYCMMGVCFECLVEVDGKPSRQACLTTVREGMVIRRQQGASALGCAAEAAGHGR